MDRAGKIIRIVAEHFGLSPDSIIGTDRAPCVVLPRQIAVFLTKEATDRSLPQIGRRFGGRDHTTMLHSIRKVTGMMEADLEFAKTIASIRTEMHGKRIKNSLRTWHPARVRRLRELWVAKKSIAEMAEAMETSPTSIGPQLRRMHLSPHRLKPAPNVTPPLTEEEVTTLTEMFEVAGAPLADIAKALGRPYDFVRGRISNLDLRRPIEKPGLNSYSACMLHLEDLRQQYPEKAKAGGYPRWSST